MSKLTILSYNLWFHKAFPELPDLVREHTVDALCLQECTVADLPQTISGLSLVRADLLNDEIGLATYINTERWSSSNTICESLSNTPYEKVLGKTDRPRLQLTRLVHQGDGKKVIIANVHIANLMSGNRGRRRQIVSAATLTLDFANGTPVIMSGDFNYPFVERGLLRAIDKAGFTQVTDKENPPASTYYRWPKRTFDRMFTIGVETTAFTVLPFGASDHAPILGEFEVDDFMSN